MLISETNGPNIHYTSNTYLSVWVVGEKF